MAALSVDASYEAVDAVPVQVLEDELRRQIRVALANCQPFYIGAAKETGTPIQSMCHREGTHCDPDAEGCPQRSRHRADNKANASGVALEKVLYAKNLIVKNEVCELETELIAEYRQQILCLNVAPGKPNCIKGRSGIVYLRIYSPLCHRANCDPDSDEPM